MTAKQAAEEMSVEEAEQLQRDFILGGDDYKLPNGQTKGEFLAAQRKKEAREAAEARERETESLRRQAAPSPERVRVRFKGGQVIAQPIAPEVKEKEEAASSKGDANEGAAKSKTAKK